MIPRTQIKGLKKLRLIFTLALMSSIAPLSTDMYLPALAHVEESFRTSPFLTQLSLASFFIAFALGQLIYGPISDAFGRKKPVLVGIALFILSSLFCVVIDNIYAFIALRFFEALGGCAGIVIARAIVNDMFEIKEAAGIYALMMVFSSLAPMLSPTFGGILLEYFSWHSIFLALFSLGVLLFCFVLFGFAESAPHLAAAGARHFSHREAIASYRVVFADRGALVFIFSAAFALSAMFAYITGSNFVFTQVFGLSEQQFAALFGCNALGFVACANINAQLVKRIDPAKILPKSLLIMLIFMCILFFNAFFHPNFWLFELSLFTSIAMLGFIAPNTTTLTMARFRDHSGTASAVLGTAQFALAGIISFAVGAINANTPAVLAIVMCGCVLAANLVYFLGRRSAAAV